MVDDFGKISTSFKVEGEVPDFFIENGLAEKIKNGYVFHPIVTSIGLIKSEFSSKHLKKTVMPFHFITKNKFNVDENITDEKRTMYRTEIASDSSHLIWKEIDKVLEDMKNTDMRSRMIVKFGILLHVFADTHAHYGFSGFHGWENWAKAQEVYNSKTGKNEKFRKPASLLPEIGHACLAHLPDAAAYKVPYKCYDANHNEISKERCNYETFKACAVQIYNWLRIVADLFPSGRVSNDVLSGEELDHFVKTLLLATDDFSEETDVDKLTEIWSKAYGYTYRYDKSDYFNLKALSAMNLHTGCLIENIDLDSFSVMSSDDSDPDEYMSILFKEPSQAFYDFNQSAYEHRFEVIGTYTL